MQPLPELFTLDHTQKYALTVVLHVIASEAAALRKRVTELETQLAKNSSDSGKLLSSEGLAKPKPENCRRRAGPCSGGQPGPVTQGLPVWADVARRRLSWTHSSSHCIAINELADRDCTENRESDLLAQILW